MWRAARIPFLSPVSPWDRFLPALLWAALIFVLSSIPGNRYPRVPFQHADKGMHAVLFFPLGWLFARALIWAPGGCRKPLLRHIFCALVAVALYGASDEIHQIWVTDRTCSLADWAVDILAGSLGVFGWLTWRRIARMRQ